MLRLQLYLLLEMLARLWSREHRGKVSVPTVVARSDTSQLSLFVHAELASDGLKGRVFEVSLADLQNDEQSFRKFRLISEDVQEKLFSPISTA